MEDKNTPVSEAGNEEENISEAEAAEASDSKKPKVKGKKNDKEELQKKLDEMSGKLAEADEQYQRLRAEYANYKRRTDQEKEQLGGFVKADTLKTLLPALDTLERAACAEISDPAQYKTGVENTLRQFSELLSSLGLESFGKPGDPFDPEIHNSVMREDAGEDDTPDTIAEVYQTGYRVGDRIIRSAMVKVIN